jgi:hypothetical protein
MFRYMSMLNFNINITAPECAIPNLPFAYKWLFIQTLPLILMSLLFLFFIFSFLTAKYIRGQTTAVAMEHKSIVVSISTLLMYYFYLMVTRSTLDVFNCQQTDPPDDWPHGYLQADGSKCFEDGGAHWRLFFGGLVTLCIYVIGYPVWAFWKLKTNKKKVKTDQILRAMGLGDYKGENPYYFFRRQYHKLYYQ